MSMLDLQGRVALVTGASRGIGLAIARRLHGAGAAVVLTARGLDPEIVASLNETRPDSASSLDGEIGSPDFTRALVKSVFARHRRLDILVNNAGIMRPARIGMISDSDIDAMIGVNLGAVIHLTQAAARLMSRSGGSIINLSSIVGRYGTAGQLAYAASKAGVIGATLASSKELAAKGIRVNAVAPGFIETQLTADLDPAVRAETLNGIGMGRAGTPDEVADVALFLASDLSRYVTGQVIGVDGGMIL